MAEHTTPKSRQYKTNERTHTPNTGIIGNEDGYNEDDDDENKNVGVVISVDDLPHKRRERAHEFKLNREHFTRE